LFRGFGSGRRAPPPPSRVPARIPQAAPAHPPTSAVGAAQPRQPGLFGQMASTAVGVGIGSAVVCSFPHIILISCGSFVIVLVLVL